MRKGKIVLIALLAAFAGFLVPQQLNASITNHTDDFIFSDPVYNIYVGRQEAAYLIGNLNFADLPAGAAAQDAIIRSGVYNFFSGNAPTFRPNDALTRQEALSFVLRMAGQEAAAQAAGAAEDVLPAGASAQDVEFMGFMALARNMGLITPEQFTAAFAPPPDPAAEPPVVVDPEADPPIVFDRFSPTTREEFADWLVQAVVSQNAAAFLQPQTLQQALLQSVYGFNDWNSISAERIQSVDLLARNGVMVGDGTNFRPLDNITRMEAAWAGRALDTIFHSFTGLQRLHGTVGAIVDAQAITDHTAELWREIRVRRNDGAIDILRFTTQLGGSPQVGTQDAVVLKNGVVGGLALLDVGDSIEYIVHPPTGTVFYVVVTGDLQRRQAMGRLQIINPLNGTATFLDETGRAHTYALAQGMFRDDGTPLGPEVRLGTTWQPLATMPYGSLFSINLTNNLITEMQFLGNFVIQPETWGIVIENNPFLGYLTIFDAQGIERTFNYNAGEIQVQKTEHYDMRNTIGGIHALFPNMRNNPRATTMDSIEPGNVVSFRTDPADPSMITALSATTNYTTRYGRIVDFRTEGNMHNFLMEFENGRTAWFSMPNSVMVRQDARPINAAQIQSGDWARLLINQATLAPGQIMESVVSMELEGGNARHINNIVRGQLTNIDIIQNQLILQNAQELGQTGWSNHRQIAHFSLTGQIDYFFNGRPVTLAYVNQFLRRSSAEAYIALENSFGGESVRMVSFRDGRDELLNPDTVVGIDGNGGFHVLSNDGAIRTDDGTIVRRNGRLVTGSQIMPWDHAVVSLNGQNNAAVVDISPAPSYSGVQIARGRVQSVDQGNSFRVQSMALFDGLEWHFTPIEREFTIDHNTLFINADGLFDINDFIDFTEDSVVDQVFNVIIDGSRAARVIDAPYATQAIRGIIYATDDGAISLRDVHVRNAVTGVWSLISNVNATATVAIPLQDNVIIVDRDQVIHASNLQIGQQIRVMVPPPLPTATAGMEVDGYIILVER
ncbi:MAG: S-layer homology domain-containing protein [Defluviitaleaceae bacterium]|nr:S-layer homology domain-containing protein [Defluviitaleaceae bacterium]